MRWFTCTPVDFGGGPDFFARDSGLVCRGFQAIGVESRAVMPGPPRPDDEPDLIRTGYRNLEDPGWWRGLGIDGVVLYAWGRPKFRKVAAAIRDAGIFLVANQDSGGLASPLAGGRDWLAEQWILTGQGRGPGSWARFAQRVLRGTTIGLIASDPLRAAHLKCCDVIGCVSPKAADDYRKLCRIYGGGELSARVKLIPHAVEERFHHAGAPKRRQIACVGRWHDSVQKRPGLMMEVMGRLLADDPDLTAVIAGEPTPDLVAWQASLPPGPRERVRLGGRLDRDALAEMLRESQVFYSPSAFESFGIAAAEALCSGCSVVAHRSNSLAAFGWFVSSGSGTLAESDTPAAHAAAIATELNLWKTGSRNPARIAGDWCDLLHAPRIAEVILKLSPNSP